MTKTTQYINTPIGPIPADWEVKKLGEVVEFLDGKRKPIKESDRSKMQGKFPYYGASGIIDYVNDFIFDDELILLGEDGANIINRSSPLAFMVEGKIWVNNHAHVLKPFSHYNRGYITEYLESISYEKFNTGTAQPKLNKDICSNILIPLPPLPEQQKIAEVLSTWDKAIQETDAIIKKLEERNKALAYSLLTGRQRVMNKENTKFHKTNLGSKYPIDWEIKTVKKIFKERKEKSNDQSKYPLFSLTIEKGLTEKTDRYERSFLLKDQESNEYKLIYPNDILFNPMNLRFGAIAKSNIDKVVSVSAYYNSIFKIDENVNLDYYTNLFKTDLFINLYDRIAIGSLLEKKRVHLSNFLELEIPFPSLKEQNAIAEILNTANQEVKQYQQKLEALKLQKKGLMQQLLTGKIRTI